MGQHRTTDTMKQQPAIQNPIIYPAGYPHTYYQPIPPPQHQSYSVPIAMNSNEAPSDSISNTEAISHFNPPRNEMLKNDLMQFDEEWIDEFPKANSVEATNWFNKATLIWEQVDNDRQQRLMQYNNNNNNTLHGINLETPTNQHNDDHFSDNQDVKTSKSVKKKSKKRNKKKKKSKSKKKKSKKSKKSKKGHS